MYVPRIYTADGETDTFSISFPYLSKEHIEVRVDGELVEDIEFPTSGQVMLAEVPKEGSIVVITRKTPLERLVDFNNTSFLSEGVLDLDSTQLLFLVQEALAEATDALGTGTYDVWNYDARGKRIVNLGDPILDTDATHKEFVEGKTEEAKGYTDVLVDGIEGRLKTHIDEELMRYAQAYFPEKIIDIPKVLWNVNTPFDDIIFASAVDKRNGSVYISGTTTDNPPTCGWRRISSNGTLSTTKGVEDTPLQKLLVDDYGNIFGGQQSTIFKTSPSGELLNSLYVSSGAFGVYQDNLFVGKTYSTISKIDKELLTEEDSFRVDKNNSGLITSLDFNKSGHIVCINQSSRLYYVLFNSKEVVWNIALSSPSTARKVMFDNEGCILGLSTSALTKFLPNGSLLWKFNGYGNYSSMTVDLEDYVYVLSDTGDVYKIPPKGGIDSGSVWKYTIEDIGANVVDIHSDLAGNIYVTTTNKVVKLNSEVFIEEVELD